MGETALGVQVIRPAHESDAQGIEHLARQEGQSVDFTGQVAVDHGRCLVVAAPQGLVGFCLAWRIADEVEILDLVVDVSQRRRGLARRLLRSLLAQEQARGAVRALLEVRATNRPAAHLYAQLGFEEVGRRERYYADGEHARVLAVDLRLGTWRD